ncbi:hypothetical protein GIB67_013962 [Kingdonia uniflora]|uniref:Cytochrome P450 n=1 Tax=Kingdonia uniflora TaxID=39325 RepID=A0A7J7LDP7_9MAGN|nr:hypothetical protein GIB67_013962 [Kingdonia uniflora]
MLLEKGLSDLQEVCKRLAFDSNMKVVLGRNLGYLSIGLQRNELSEAIDYVQDGVLYRHIIPMFWWKILRWLNVGRENKLDARKTRDDLLGKYITLRRESLSQGIDATDMLSMYIKVPHEMCKDDMFLRDTMFNMFIAGWDTVAAGLIWFL